MESFIFNFFKSYRKPCAFERFMRLESLKNKVSCLKKWRRNCDIEWNISL